MSIKIWCRRILNILLSLFIIGFPIVENEDNTEIFEAVLDFSEGVSLTTMSSATIIYDFNVSDIRGPYFQMRIDNKPGAETPYIVKPI